MPTYETWYDANSGEGQRREAEQTIVEVDPSLTVCRIRVKWGEVSFFDELGREAVLIQRGTYPGAGMNVNFADHVTFNKGATA